MKLAPIANFIEFYNIKARISPLKTLHYWATFTSQLILRLKTSVMKRVVQPNDAIAITVWEE